MISAKYSKYAFLAASIAILLGIVFYINPGVIASHIEKSDKVMLLAAFVLANVTLVLRALKWYVLLTEADFIKLLPVQMFGMTISNLTPGKIAEPVKSVVLKFYCNTPVSLSLPTVIWERVLDLIVLLFFSMIASAFFIEKFVIGVIPLLVFTALVILMVLVIYNKPLGRKLFSILRKFRLNVTEEFIDAFYSSKIEKRRILLSLAITFAVWLMDGALFFLVIKSVANDFNLSVMEVTSLWALSLLAGLITSLPGGMGGSDVVMILLLSFLGVEKGVAGSGVLLARAFSLGYGLLVGYLSFLYLIRKIDMKHLKTVIDDVIS